MVCDYCGALILDAPFKLSKAENPDGKFDQKNFCSNKCIKFFLGQQMEETLSILR